MTRQTNRRFGISALAVLVSPLLLAAQTTPPLPSLASYLSLTEAQVSAIAANNAAYNRAALTRQDRLAQVENEIREETAKDPLNPGALGARYVEIETNCRELGEEGRRLRERNLAVLNEAQKVRVKALEDALRLVVTANNAQGAGLVVFDRPQALYVTALDQPIAPSAAAGPVFPWPPSVLPVTSCLLNPVGFAARTQGAAPAQPSQAALRK